MLTWSSASASAVVVLLLAACSADAYEREADLAVAEILGGRTESTLGGRESSVVHPKSRVVEPAPALEEPVNPDDSGPAPLDPYAGPPARILALRDALEIAIHSNRDYVSRKESLYLTALSLTGTQYDYSPRVSAALSYLFSGSDSGPETHTSALSAGARQVLPWGGETSLAARSSFAGGDGDSYGSSLAIALTQPLLRGAGREIAWEALKQAERGLIYAIRDFELYREDFSIDVASRYYDLVQQRQSVDNQRLNLDDFVFGRKQAEALFSVGRTSELEVLRARRSELTSQNSLIEAEEGIASRSTGSASSSGSRTPSASRSWARSRSSSRSSTTSTRRSRSRL